VIVVDVVSWPSFFNNTFSNKNLFHIDTHTFGICHAHLFTTDTMFRIENVCWTIG
jgi:hypothetical protein